MLETNMTEIITRIEEQNKLEKSEVRMKIIFIINHGHWSLDQKIKRVDLN